MPKVYYVNSANGSDTNAGTSADAPLASVAAVEKLKLNPGDTVLFARGTSYQDQLDVKYSGSVANPITFGAYGEGEPPLLHGAERGIYGSKASNIVVKDMAIAETNGNAVYAGGANNWVLDNLTITDTGAIRAGSISFQSSTNITIRNSSLEGINSDGIWMDGVKGATIEGNRIGTVQGHTADNVQVVNSSGVVIRGNVLDMTADTNSSKGNLVVNHSDGVVIEGNALTGGGFGASVNSDNVVITGNEISGQSGYSWTYAIGLGEKWDVSNYVISNNFIHDTKYGVFLTGIGATPVMRSNVEITGNVFEDMTGAALKVDRPSSGSFHDNYISTNSPGVAISAGIIAAGTFEVGKNTSFVTTDPQANLDTALIGATQSVAHGNIVANDTSLTNSKLSVASLDNVAMDKSVTIEGKYGVLTVNKDGTYSYAVDNAKMHGVDQTVQEAFDYLVSDGKNKAYSTINISIEARPNDAPLAVNDLAACFASGKASGNLLVNDTDAQGDLLKVSGVNGLNIGDGTSQFTGKYGTLLVHSDGSYSYQLDMAKQYLLPKDATESFQIAINDGRAAGISVLSIDLSAAVPVPKTNVKPIAVDDKFGVDQWGRATGNILANDFDPNGTAVYLRTVDDAKVSGKATVLTGDYGTLTILSNGEFVYQADTNAAHSAGKTIKDSFQYKISDSSMQDVGSLSITINPDDLLV